MRFDGLGGPRVKIFELADSKVPSPAFSVEFFQLFSFFFHFSINWGAKFFSRMVPKFYSIFMHIFPRASLLRLTSMAHFHYPRAEVDLKVDRFLEKSKSTTHRSRHSVPRGAAAMKTVSLFSGIGGLDLGLEDAGHEIILQVESDPHCIQARPARPSWLSSPSEHFALASDAFSALRARLPRAQTGAPAPLPRPSAASRRRRAHRASPRDGAPRRGVPVSGASQPTRLL